ncbi:MAG: hypothetical protein WA160_16565 [Pseudobdellovibrio sp.]
MLPLDTALTKAVALSGNQIFSVDQDVIFKGDSEDYLIKENWLIEGDKNLILTATGQGALKDLFHVVIFYNSKNKTIMQGKNKLTSNVTTDFFERFLSIRSLTSFKNYLSDLTIAKTIRLSRVAGSPGLAIGEPSTNSLKPQIWLDQETFQIRKIRFPSETEVSFDDYAAYDKITYPKTKTITWGHQTALIKVRQVTTKVKANLANFYPQKLDQPSEINLSSKGQLGLTIQEFYTRFR